MVYFQSTLLLLNCNCGWQAFSRTRIMMLIPRYKSFQLKRVFNRRPQQEFLILLNSITIIHLFAFTARFFYGQLPLMFKFFLFKFFHFSILHIHFVFRSFFRPSDTHFFRFLYVIIYSQSLQSCFPEKFILFCFLRSVIHDA